MKYLFCLIMCCCQLLALAQLSSEQVEQLKKEMEKDKVKSFQKYVKKNKIKVEQIKIDEQNLLEYAVSENKFTLANFLINKIPPSEEMIGDKDWVHTISCYQSSEQSFQFLNQLLQRRSKESFRNDEFMRLICYFDTDYDTYKDVLPCYKTLIKKGMDMNAVYEDNEEKTTLLLYICSYEKETLEDNEYTRAIQEFVIDLIQLGADPHKAVNGKTPYKEASEYLQKRIDELK